MNRYFKQQRILAHIDVYVCYCASSIPIPIYRSINMKFTIINRQSCPALLLCPQVPSGASGVPRCLWCPQVPLMSPGASGVPSTSGACGICSVPCWSSNVLNHLHELLWNYHIMLGSVFGMLIVSFVDEMPKTSGTCNLIWWFCYLLLPWH